MRKVGVGGCVCVLVNQKILDRLQMALKLCNKLGKPLSSNYTVGLLFFIWELNRSTSYKSRVRSQTPKIMKLETLSILRV
jgi:hypothetical protein